MFDVSVTNRFTIARVAGWLNAEEMDRHNRRSALGGISRRGMSMAIDVPVPKNFRRHPPLEPALPPQSEKEFIGQVLPLTVGVEPGSTPGWDISGVDGHRKKL